MASISEQAQDIPTDELRSQLDGELITPNDSSYDEARHVFFKGIDRRPLAVARVAGAADVARVVTAARETGLDLAVRSGGHNRAGHGTSEGGLVIDLSGMNAVEIDARWRERLGRDRRDGGPVHEGDRRNAGVSPASATPARSGSAGSPSPAASASWSARTG